ncbi:hypothetical protein BCR39DRAFT_562259 [Naematelia encephala]|uniref:Uncharacterized protein n=1 Tax=Naematelia encephala TaxID=71784 RepID=A0A1Y2AKZ3_9TREE|nr:hypothetical protein BCR39DRAFT_562259 [Naematelia encephala]
MNNPPNGDDWRGNAKTLTDRLNAAARSGPSLSDLVGPGPPIRFCSEHPEDDYAVGGTERSQGGSLGTFPFVRSSAPSPTTSLSRARFVILPTPTESHAPSSEQSPTSPTTSGFHNPTGSDSLILATASTNNHPDQGFEFVTSTSDPTMRLSSLLPAAATTVSGPSSTGNISAAESTQKTVGETEPMRPGRKELFAD